MTNIKIKFIQLNMNKSKVKETFSESIFSLIISEVIIKTLGIVYKIYITNKPGFGDEGNAISQGAFQVFALLLSVTAIGIPNTVSKLVAEKSAQGDHKTAYKIFKISLVMFSTIGIIATYLLIVYSKTLANNYLNIKESELSIIALAPSIFLSVLISILRGYFIGRKSIKITAKSQSKNQIYKTLFTVILIEASIYLLHKNDTEIMASLNNFALTIGNIIEVISLLKNFIKEYPQIKHDIKTSINTNNESTLKIISSILKLNIPLSLSALISTISKNIDSITIVNKLKTVIGYESAKKQYGILSGKADALVNLPLSFSSAIVGAILPIIASANGDHLKYKDKLEKTLQLELVIALPIMFVYLIFAKEILEILFPNAPEGAIILQISSLQILVVCIEQLINTVLNGMGKTIIIIKSVLIGTIVKIVLNYILVPNTKLFIGGTNGAAFATLVCHIVICLISYFSIRKSIKVPLKIFVKPTIISVIFILSFKLLFEIMQWHSDIRISLVLSGIISIVLYLVMIIKTQIINKKQILNLIRIKK